MRLYEVLIDTIYQANSIKLTPAALLRKLALDIHAEIPDLSFDRFKMSSTARELLEELRETLVETFGTSQHLITKQCELPLVVDYAFMAAAGFTEISKPEEDEPVEDHLSVAAMVLRKFLERGRGSFIKERAGRKVEPEGLADVKPVYPMPWDFNSMMVKMNPSNNLKETKEEEG